MVYIDLVILENFIVNFFLLFLTSKSLKINTKLIRNVMAAFLGSLYVMVFIYPSLKFLNNIIVKIFIAFIMEYIAFGQRDVVFNIKATVMYIVYSMIVAGICMFMECNINNFSSELYIKNFSYKKLMMAMMIIYIIGNKLVWYIKDRKEIKNFIYDVDIVVGDNCTKVRGFLDTGNELVEPVTNLPVLIVEEGIFKNINLKQQDKYYIPYKVINGSLGNLKGFKPNYIQIYNGDKKERKEAIIAFSKQKLSNLKDYEALLSRGII